MSETVMPTTEVFAWLRGDYFLTHFIPLDIDPIKTPRASSSLPSAHAAHFFLDCCQRDGFHDELRQDQFEAASEEIGLEVSLSAVVFNNCTRRNREVATIQELALDIVLLGLEHYSCSPLSSPTTRGDVMYDFVKSNLEDILQVIVRAQRGCTKEDVLKTSFNGFGSALKKQLLFLDLIFEGMIENGKDVESNRDDVTTLSSVVAETWMQRGEISLNLLIRNIRSCLISDPFILDSMPIEKPLPSPRAVRRTSLAAGSHRRVAVSSWRRLQLLTKTVFRDVHLSLSASHSICPIVVAPWRTLSVLIDNVADCESIVLGPCQGTVIIRDCHRITVSVVCSRIHVWNCSDITVFHKSEHPMVLREAYDLRIAPFNTAYTGLNSELEECGYGNLPNRCEEPIILDSSSWSLVEPSHFYCQPVPIEVDDLDMQTLVCSLPTAYQNAWRASLLEAEKEEDDTDNALRIRASDLVYLRTKTNSS